MEEVLKPALCVIGAGSGGLSVAAAAAQFGVPVVLIANGRMGGDCLNHGCAPPTAPLPAGATASIPPIPGLDEVPYFTNETIVDVSERIQHLIVLGGGPVGLELAQAHRLLRSHVSA